MMRHLFKKRGLYDTPTEVASTSVHDSIHSQNVSGSANHRAYQQQQEKQRQQQQQQQEQERRHA
jgi:hypothetical protein